MGRREKPIDPGAGPVQRFACELRKLRRATYREMAREATYSTAALARAAAGETLPSLPLTLAYVRACNGDPADWEHRWHAARAEETIRPRNMDEEAADPPYRGLARFEPDDHAWFFGRTRLTDNLTALARERRCLIVLGPSGSGKSSLLRAGLIPRLRTAQDPVLRPAAIRILTPGPRPVHAHRELFAPAPGPGDTCPGSGRHLADGRSVRGGARAGAHEEAERVARRVAQDAYVILRLGVRHRRPQGKSVLDG